MWRIFFLSVGISLTIFGAEFLVIEKATWAKEADKSDVQQVAGYLVDDKNAGEQVKDDKSAKEFKPQPWVPWAMLSSGAIVILYCVSIKKES